MTLVIIWLAGGSFKHHPILAHWTTVGDAIRCNAHQKNRNTLQRAAWAAIPPTTLLLGCDTANLGGWGITRQVAIPIALVAMYRAMRLWFGYGLKSCDAQWHCPRNVNNQNLARQRPFSYFSLLVVRNRSWKSPNEGNFTLRFVWHRNVAICVSKVHPRNGRCRGETCVMRNC